MAVYCITYEIKYDAKHYDNLVSAIKSYSAWYYQGSNVWFIKAGDDDNAAAIIRDYLYRFMYKDDKLFIIRVVRGWAGTGYEQNEYDWLQQNLN